MIERLTKKELEVLWHISQTTPRKKKAGEL